MLESFPCWTVSVSLSIHSQICLSSATESSFVWFSLSVFPHALQLKSTLCLNLWLIPPIFRWRWRSERGGATVTVEFDSSDSPAGFVGCGAFWNSGFYSLWFKNSWSWTTMRRRSSSNASRRSSTLRRRSENLRFDVFGFAITKRKEQKVHHRCHDYRCGTEALTLS